MSIEEKRAEARLDAEKREARRNLSPLIKLYGYTGILDALRAEAEDVYYADAVTVLNKAIRELRLLEAAAPVPYNPSKNR